MAIVVSDTSPIRALNHLGLVAILKQIYGRVLVPGFYLASKLVADVLREAGEELTS